MPGWARAASLAAVLACLLVPPAAAEPAKPTSSRIEKRTYDFKEAGKEMEYALFVPTTYDKAKKSPLIVALHGLGSNPQQIMRYRGLTDLAEKHGYVVVAPMGYNSRGWYGARAMVKGREGDPKNLGELSQKDVMNVLGIVRKAYSIDPDRVYLMGHSMGGGGAFHLAFEHPDLWAALAPIAPALSRPAKEVGKIKHIPVILVQGDADRLVRVERVRPWAAEMKRLGMEHEYVEIAGGDHVGVASAAMPKIFAFFEKHERAPKGKEKK